MNIPSKKSLNFIKKSLMIFSILKISFLLLIPVKSFANEKKSSTPVEILTKRAQTKYEKGDFKGAYSDYQKVLNFDSKNYNAYVNIAAYQLKKFNFKDAVVSYKTVLKYNPSLNFPEKNFILAIQKYETEEFEESRIYLEKFFTNENNSLFNRNAKIYKGLLNFHNGNYRNAIEILESQLPPFNPYASKHSLSNYYCSSNDCEGIILSTIGKSFYFLKDYSKAASKLQQKRRKNFNFKDYYYLGVSYFKLKKYNLSQYNLRQVIKLNPTPKFASSAYSYKGLINFFESDYINAIKNFDKALNLNSEDGDTFNNRGLAKHNLGNFKGAIEDYTISINLDKREPKGFIRYGNRLLSYRSIGERQKRKGKFEESKLSFKKACEDYFAYKNLRGTKRSILALATQVCK